MPAMSEADNLTNLAFPERLDSVNSTAADQANTYPRIRLMKH